MSLQDLHFVMQEKERNEKSKIGLSLFSTDKMNGFQSEINFLFVPPWYLKSDAPAISKWGTSLECTGFDSLIFAFSLRVWMMVSAKLFPDQVNDFSVGQASLLIFQIKVSGRF